MTGPNKFGRAGEPSHLFVYGTLVDPRRLAEVLGHPHPGEVLRACLRGYRRVASPSYAFPFIVADPAARVDGLLVMDLAPADLAALDAYEEVDAGVYRRVPVEVDVWGCGSGAARLTAETYAVGPALEARVGGAGLTDRPPDLNP